MATKYNMTIDQGTTFIRRFKITGYDFSKDVWVAFSQIRSTPKSRNVLGEFTTDFIDDIVTISLEPEESSVWVWSNGVYDVELHSDSGIVLRIVEGVVKLSLEVTRIV